MMVAWHVVVGLGEVTRIVVEMIPPPPPLINCRIIGSWRFVFALQQYLPMLVLFGLVEKQILVGGCRRVHLSLR